MLDENQRHSSRVEPRQRGAAQSTNPLHFAIDIIRAQGCEEVHLRSGIRLVHVVKRSRKPIELRLAASQTFIAGKAAKLHRHFSGLRASPSRNLRLWSE